MFGHYQGENEHSYKIQSIKLIVVLGEVLVVEETYCLKIWDKTENFIFILTRHSFWCIRSKDHAVHISEAADKIFL